MMHTRQIPAAIETGLVAAAAFLAAPFQLAIRLYVGWVFVKSGWLKLSDWSQTLSLFQTEYHAPLLPPALAAVVGTAGELGCGVLVILGLIGRGGALGLFAVNALAVISYRDVLLADGFEAALAQHVLWGFMLLVLAVHGPGRWSLDRLTNLVPAPRGAPA